MKYTKEEIQELAYKWRMGTINASEKQAYLAWYNSHNDAIGTLDESFGSEEAIRQRLWLDISAKLVVNQTATSPMSRWYKSTVFRVAVAATVLLLCYFGFRNDQAPLPVEIPTIAFSIREPEADLIKHATLLLSSGERVDLDKLSLGEVVEDKGFRVRKVANQKIVYLQSTALAGVGNYSQDILLPKHRTYEVVLADGTQVWMNAWSKLRVFDNILSPNRGVHLDGEAYFEVAKTKGQALFTVHTADQIIDVLGTHFNVRAYANSLTRTSLLEGSVRVNGKRGIKPVVLAPGQEALSLAGIRVQAFDVEHVMAWREDVFYFDSTDLAEVLRELERWYPLAVDYSQLPKGLTFSGKVSRSRTLDEILDAIERTSHVEFKLTEGRLNFEK